MRVCFADADLLMVRVAPVRGVVGCWRVVMVTTR